mgnify:FL=1
MTAPLAEVVWALGRSLGVTVKGFQFLLWWPLHYWGLHMYRYEPPLSLARVYRWSLVIGPLEVRRWA